MYFLAKVNLNSKEKKVICVKIRCKKKLVIVLNSDENYKIVLDFVIKMYK